MKNQFLIISLFFISCCFKSQTPFCFSGSPSYYTYNLNSADQSGSIESLDINNDGNIDILYGTNFNIKYRLGLGTGLFSATTATINTGGVVFTTIEIIDLNNDGFMDIVGMNGSAPTYIRNLGTGSFAAPVQMAPSTFISDYTFNDFDNDGYKDMIVITTNTSNYTIIKNNANNTFSTSVVSLSFQPTSICSGEFNSDGNKDFLIGYNFSNCIYIFNGTGSLSFTQSSQTITTTFTPDKIEGKDFTNDGIDDVCSVSSLGSTSIYKGLGANNFNKHIDFTVRAMGSIGSRRVYYKDINNDTYKDIVINNGLGDNISVLLGDPTNLYLNNKLYATGNTPCNIAINDLNNDGYLDVISGNRYSNYSIHLGNSNGLSTSVYLQLNGNMQLNGSDYTTGDFNNDGFQDIIANSDSLRIFQSSGMGTFSVALCQKIVNSGQYAIHSLDFNKDGNRDIVLARSVSSVSKISVFLGNGNNTFQAPFDATIGGSVMFINSFDYDNDTYPDIIAMDGTWLKVFKNNGGTSIASPFMISNSGGGRNVDFGDFNSDGFTDICYGIASTNSVCTIINNGGTSFNAPTIFNICNSGSMEKVTTCDYNKDGKTDIFSCQGSCTGVNIVVSVLRGNGNNTFNAPISFTAMGDPQDIINGDINNDTYPDIICGGLLYGSVNILVNNKLGGFNNYNIKAAAAPKHCTLADFNNDGMLDLATGFNSSLSNNEVSVFYNNTIKISPVTNQTLCAGAPLTIKKFGAYPNFSWTPSGSTADSIIVTTSGFYSATSIGSIGQCSCAVGINVTANPSPTVNISGTSTLCLGNTATLTSSGATSYTWSTGVNGNSITVTPTVSTNYSVTGTSAGCNGTSSISLSVNPCTSIIELKNDRNSFEIYPNPVNSSLKIHLINRTLLNKTIVLKNILGETIKQFEIDRIDYDIDLSELTSGLYFIVIESETRKLIKN